MCTFVQLSSFKIRGPSRFLSEKQSKVSDITCSRLSLCVPVALGRHRSMSATAPTAPRGSPHPPSREASGPRRIDDACFCLRSSVPSHRLRLRGRVKQVSLQGGDRRRTQPLDCGNTETVCKGVKPQL